MRPHFRQYHLRTATGWQVVWAKSLPAAVRAATYHAAKAAPNPKAST